MTVLLPKLRNCSTVVQSWTVACGTCSPNDELIVKIDCILIIDGGHRWPVVSQRWNLQVPYWQQGGQFHDYELNSCGLNFIDCMCSTHFDIPCNLQEQSLYVKVALMLERKFSAHEKFETKHKVDVFPRISSFLMGSLAGRLCLQRAHFCCECRPVAIPFWGRRMRLRTYSLVRCHDCGSILDVLHAPGKLAHWTPVYMHTFSCCCASAHHLKREVLPRNTT